jgi:hypothetical protein
LSPTNWITFIPLDLLFYFTQRCQEDSVLVVKVPCTRKCWGEEALLMLLTPRKASIKDAEKGKDSGVLALGHCLDMWPQGSHCPILPSVSPPGQCGQGYYLPLSLDPQEKLMR